MTTSKSNIAGPKLRADSWAAPLSEAQRWDVYFRMKRGRWTDVARWIEEELGIEAPGRTALYEFARRMRAGEQAWRVENAVAAAAEAGELARDAEQKDEHLTAAFRALAADTAMRTGDAGAAKRWMDMSLALAAERTKKVELALKAKAQKTKDEQLKLARERFEAAEARLEETAAAVRNLDAAGGLTPEAREIIEKAMGVL